MTSICSRSMMTNAGSSVEQHCELPLRQGACKWQGQDPSRWQRTLPILASGVTELCPGHFGMCRRMCCHGLPLARDGICPVGEKAVTTKLQGLRAESGQNTARTEHCTASSQLCAPCLMPAPTRALPCSFRIQHGATPWTVLRLPSRTDGQECGGLG